MQLVKNCGIDFICVLSGETKHEDIKGLKDPPEIIVNKVAVLISFLENS